jgi:hypothetical protein
MVSSGGRIIFDAALEKILCLPLSTEKELVSHFWIYFNNQVLIAKGKHKRQRFSALH